MDEPRPRVLSQPTLSSQLIMSFTGQVAHHDAYVLMDSVASHCFVSYDFAKTFGLKVKRSSNTLVLGNGDEVPTEGTLKSTLKYNNIKAKLLAWWQK